MTQLKASRLARNISLFSIVGLLSCYSYAVTICAGPCPPDITGGGVGVSLGGGTVSGGTVTLGGASGGGIISSGGVLVVSNGGLNLVGISLPSASTDTNLTQLGGLANRNFVRFLSNTGSSFSASSEHTTADISELLLNGVKVADAGTNFDPSWLPHSSDNTSDQSAFWVSPLAGYSNSNDSSSRGVRTRSSGIALGLEKRVSDQTLAGVAYSNSLSQSEDLGLGVGRSHIGSNDLAAYALWSHEAWSNRAVIAVGWQHYSNFGFSVQGTTKGTSYSGYDELGYELAMTDGVALRPIALLSASHSSFDSYSESGGGTTLQVNGEKANSEVGGLGIRAIRDFGGDMKIRLEARTICFHEFGDVKTRWSAQFSGIPISVVGPETPRNSVLLGGRVIPPYLGEGESRVTRPWPAAVSV